MTDQKKPTKAGTTELTEEELDEAKGGVTIANNFEEVRRDKKADGFKAGADLQKK